MVKAFLGILSFFLSFVLGLVLVLSFDDGVYGIQFTPASPLYPAFVEYISQYGDFFVFVDLAEDSELYTQYIEILPFDTRPFNFFVSLPRNHFMYDIFAAIYAPTYIHTYPLDFKSDFVCNLLDIYLKSKTITNAEEHSQAVAFFFNELIKVCKNPIHVPTGENFYRYHFLFNEYKRSAEFFDLMLKGIDTKHYYFVKPQFLSKTVELFNSFGFSVYDLPRWYLLIDVNILLPLQKLAVSLYIKHGAWLLAAWLVLFIGISGFFWWLSRTIINIIKEEYNERQAKEKIRLAKYNERLARSLSRRPKWRTGKKGRYTF